MSYRHFIKRYRIEGYGYKVTFWLLPSTTSPSHIAKFQIDKYILITNEKYCIYTFICLICYD